MKAKKKPAKKAPSPKIKLKEGKYSHKFLCRLEPEIGKKLEELSKLTNNKTLNGTLKYIIVDYQESVKLVTERIDKINIANANVAQYKRLIENFKASVKALQEIKPITKVQTNMFDDQEDN